MNLLMKLCPNNYAIKKLVTASIFNALLIIFSSLHVTIYIIPKYKIQNHKLTVRTQRWFNTSRVKHSRQRKIEECGRASDFRKKRNLWKEAWNGVLTAYESISANFSIFHGGRRADFRSTRARARVCVAQFPR